MSRTGRRRAGVAIDIDGDYSIYVFLLNTDGQVERYLSESELGKIADWLNTGWLALAHNEDSDCDVDPKTNLCRGCGVEHFEPCVICGGKAFHKGGCAEADPNA